jgi:ectoine hydroxylase-related dioxygenase (phytanoyl-CoA dioxygenase family)
MIAQLDNDSATAVRTALDRDGFTILKGALAGEPIRDFASGIAAMFAPHSLPGEDVLTASDRIGREDNGLLHRIYLYSRYSYAMNRMRQFCFGIAKDLLPNLGFYLDIDSGVIFCTPGDETRTWRWHQESTYHHDMVDSLGFWFPIFAPATKLNGAMSVLKGTHKLGKVNYVKHKASAEAATSLVPEHIDDYVKQYEEVYTTCDVGDAVLFDKNLIHRSNMNRSDKSRITGLVRVGTTPVVPPKIDKVY